jgi:hypothetical protein
MYWNGASQNLVCPQKHSSHAVKLQAALTSKQIELHSHLGSVGWVAERGNFVCGKHAQRVAPEHS